MLNFMLNGIPIGDNLNVKIIISVMPHNAIEKLEALILLNEKRAEVFEKAVKELRSNSKPDLGSLYTSLQKNLDNYQQELNKLK